MAELTPRERSLVSLGAAIGSNCIPCIEHHIPASRRAGLKDEQIAEAICVADELRQVPARRTLDAAARLLGDSAKPASTQAANAGGPCCG